jgi:hypothetical protein
LFPRAVPRNCVKTALFGRFELFPWVFFLARRSALGQCHLDWKVFTSRPVGLFGARHHKIQDTMDKKLK